MYAKSELINNVLVVEIHIMDTQYRKVGKFVGSNVYGAWMDCHDFAFIRNGSAILAIEQIYHKAYKTDVGVRPIREAGIRVVDVETGKVEFKWRSLDHVAVNESCVSLTLEAGEDYLYVRSRLFFCFSRNSSTNNSHSHANSITSTSSGDYLLSGYHSCTIYLISHTTGSILWRLGGPFSDFTFIPAYSLSNVHNIRIRHFSSVKLPPSLKVKVSEETHLVISLFHNAFDTTKPPTASSSSALVILLDLVAKTATIIESYPHPGGAFAAMFGSVDFLPNGDRFVGWGSLKEATQFTSNGEVLWHAQTGDKRTMIGSLRTLKREWHSARKLDSRPDGFGYSWVCGWKSALYASWNGATEVGSWRFYGGNETGQEGSWSLLGMVLKNGFETMIMAEEFVRWAYVEAVAGDGEVLGQSKAFKIWVPPVVESRGCSEQRCPEAVAYFEDTSDLCFEEQESLNVARKQVVLGVQDTKQQSKNRF